MLRQQQQGIILATFFILFRTIIAKEQIVVKYDFYMPGKYRGFCQPGTRWNSSTIFSFNDTSPLPNLLVKNESVHKGQHLRISCTSSQPLQWILGVPETSAKLSNYYLEREDAEEAPENRYHICVTFKDLKSFSGTVRCESILNGTLGAEIFIQNEAMRPTFGDCSEPDQEFLVSSSENIVPCKMGGKAPADKNSIDVRLVVKKPGSKGASEGSADLATPHVLHSDRSNYDPRIGFLLNETVVPNSRFMCIDNGLNVTDDGDCQRYIAVSEAEEAVDLSIDYYNENYGLSGSDEMRCSVENAQVHKLDLHMVACTQLGGCAHRNTAPRVYLPYTTTETTRTMRDGKAMRKSHVNKTIITPPPSGLVYCRGRLKKGGESFGKYDYFFKGLQDEHGHDGQGRFVSKGVPLSAVISLTKEFPSAGSKLTHSFRCKSSTFMLFRVFSITLEFGPKRLDFFVHAPPNHRQVLETKTYRISAVAKAPTQPDSYVWINISSNELTFVRCSAPFMHNMSWASVERNVTLNAGRNWTSVAAWVVPVVVATVSTVVAALLFWKYKKNKALTQGLTAEEIARFRFGYGAAGCVNNVDTAIIMTALDSDGLLNVNALGFPAQYQIPFNQLQIHKNDLLGEGEFAFCFRGKFNGAAVAVKMLKSSVQTEDFKNYLKEVKLMAYIGQHPNIIHFYGAVIERLDQKIAPIVVELSPYGQLLKFLRERGRSAGGGVTLTDADLISFCAQIASGMEYLHRKNVIHSDLATRNVLVFEGMTVKITDFGLSKNLYESSFYSRRHQQVRLPWPWMAPESLEFLTFSVHSDIWSYGVVAWEIFTLGQVPFTEHAWTTEFMRGLTHEGLRLRKPTRATDKIYEFLHLCWSTEPLERPSFTEIKGFFTGLMIPTGSALSD